MRDLTPDGLPPEDVQLLDELGQILATSDPVPVEITAAAKAAIHVPRHDAELADLLDGAAYATATRGPAYDEMLTFSTPSLLIDVQLVADGGTRMVGRLVPEQSASLTLEHSGGSIGARADDDGEFDIDGFPGGPIRLHLTTDDGTAVVTPWFTV